MRLCLKIIGSITSLKSDKGGVGKTLTAANLAATLTLRGQKTLLIDLDLGNPCIDEYLGAYTEPTAFPRSLFDLITYTATPLESIQHTNFGLDYISGITATQWQKNLRYQLQPEQWITIKNLLENLQTVYDHIILDFGGGSESYEQQILSHSNKIIIVLDNSPGCLKNNKDYIQLLLSYHNEHSEDTTAIAPEDILILGNRITATESDLLKQNIASFIKTITGSNKLKYAHIPPLDLKQESRERMYSLDQSAPASNYIRNLATKFILTESHNRNSLFSSLAHLFSNEKQKGGPNDVH